MCSEGLKHPSTESAYRTDGKLYWSDVSSHPVSHQTYDYSYRDNRLTRSGKYLPDTFEDRVVWYGPNKFETIPILNPPSVELRETCVRKSKSP